MFDGVDAEVGFEVEVWFQQVGWVSGHVGHDPGDHTQHLIAGGFGNGFGHRSGSFRDRRWLDRWLRGSRRRNHRRRGWGSGWSSGQLPVVGDRDRRFVFGGGRGADVNHTQTAMVDFDLRSLAPGDRFDPGLPGNRIDDPVLVAEGIGCSMDTVGHRSPTQQRHRNL